MKFKLCTAPYANPKTAKSADYGYLNLILHLAPFDLSGYQVCRDATNGCAAACLNTAGRGGIIKRGEDTNAIQVARVRRTHLFFKDRDRFADMLWNDITKLVNVSALLGLRPAVRANGTSDLPWELIKLPGKFNGRTLMEAWQSVQFYDYTKVPIEKRGIGSMLPPNYDLTYSMNEGDESDYRAVQYLEHGYRAAAVFRKELPSHYYGVPVVPGDDHDLTFTHPPCILGLKAKGKAVNDTSGFVLD